MNIKLKVTLWMSAVAVFGALIISIAIGTESSDVSSQGLKKSAKNQLIFTRDTKKIKLKITSKTYAAKY